MGSAHVFGRLSYVSYLVNHDAHAALVAVTPFFFLHKLFFTASAAASSATSATSYAKEVLRTLKEEKLEAERRQEQAKLDADAAHDDAYDKVIAATGDEVGFVQLLEHPSSGLRPHRLERRLVSKLFNP